MRQYGDDGDDDDAGDGGDDTGAGGDGGHDSGVGGVGGVAGIAGMLESSSVAPLRRSSMLVSERAGEAPPNSALCAARYSAKLVACFLSGEP